MSKLDNIHAYTGGSAIDLFGGTQRAIADLGNIMDKYQDREDKERARDIQIKQFDTQIARSNAEQEESKRRWEYEKNQHLADKQQAQLNADRSYLLQADQALREKNKYDLEERNRVDKENFNTKALLGGDGKNSLYDQSAAKFNEGVQQATAVGLVDKIAENPETLKAIEQLNSNIKSKLASDDRFKNLSLEQANMEALNPDYASYNTTSSNQGLTTQDRKDLFTLMDKAKYEGAAGDTHLFGGNQTEATNRLSMLARSTSDALASDSPYVSSMADAAAAETLKDNGVMVTPEHVAELRKNILAGRLTGAEQIAAHKAQVEEARQGATTMATVTNASNGKNASGVTVNSSKNTVGSVLDDEGERVSALNLDNKIETPDQALNEGIRTIAKNAEKNDPWLRDSVSKNLQDRGEYITKAALEKIKEKDIQVKYPSLLKRATEDYMYGEYGNSPSINFLNTDITGWASNSGANAILDKYKELEASYDSQQKTKPASEYKSALKNAADRYEKLIQEGAPSTDKILLRSANAYLNSYK